MYGLEWKWFFFRLLCEKKVEKGELISCVNVALKDKDGCEEGCEYEKLK